MSKRENLSYKKYGLIGRNISYSFSPKYFSNKFQKLNIKATYDIYDLEEINDIKGLFKKNDFSGLNVTIPYKEEIIPFLDELSPAAKAIGAVNTIQFVDGKKIGHNTDYLGFTKSIKPIILAEHKRALILGNGGASKAIKFSLKQLGIEYKTVSRMVNRENYIYSDLNQNLMKQFQIIINTTPLGTFPDINNIPNIPIKFIDERFIVYDLIYNPNETKLLELSRKQGSTTKNGLEMLEIQAEEAWKLWN